MQRLEEEYLHIMPQALRDLVKQLEISNKLKALELKSRNDLAVSPEMVDAIFAD